MKNFLSLPKTSQIAGILQILCVYFLAQVNICSTASERTANLIKPYSCNKSVVGKAVPLWETRGNDQGSMILIILKIGSDDPVGWSSF